ncbi:unnamed protein product, partial [Ectocarpus fasciculatus]
MLRRRARRETWTRLRNCSSRRRSCSPGPSRLPSTSPPPTPRPRSWGTRPSRSCACATSAARCCPSSTPTIAWR